MLNGLLKTTFYMLSTGTRIHFNKTIQWAGYSFQCKTKKMIINLILVFLILMGIMSLPPPLWWGDILFLACLCVSTIPLKLFI